MIIDSASPVVVKVRTVQSSPFCKGEPPSGLGHVQRISKQPMAWRPWKGHGISSFTTQDGDKSHKGGYCSEDGNCQWLSNHGGKTHGGKTEAESNLAPIPVSYFLMRETMRRVWCSKCVDRSRITSLFEHCTSVCQDWWPNLPLLIPLGSGRCRIVYKDGF